MSINATLRSLLVGAVLLVLYATLCVAVDPFAVFSDPISKGCSFCTAKAPSLARISFLERHHCRYDSYAVGCCSPYPLDSLNEYLNARFYNLIDSSLNWEQTAQITKYIITAYKPQNLLVSLGFEEGTGPFSARVQHYKVDGSSPLFFYARFAFLNPRCLMEEFRARNKAGVPQDIFDVETGNLYPHPGRITDDLPPDPDLQRYLDSIEDIKLLCEEYGVNALFILPPVHERILDHYGAQAWGRYRSSLAEIIEFWDFSETPFSSDSRFFSDDACPCNALGTMMLARLFNDDSKYVPEGFGRYVINQGETSSCPPAEGPKTAPIPILMYHHLAKTGDPSTTISPTMFEQHICVLQDAGYTSVSLGDLERFVNSGIPLPEKPVCITFDDGYLSNYEKAFPILKAYGWKATIFVIGATVGNQQTYKDTQHPITPHFTWEQAREMRDSGLISIQSHTYDMHQLKSYDGQDARESVLPLPDETEGEYMNALRADLSDMKEAMQKEMGYAPHALAFPHGKYPQAIRTILYEAGITITLATGEGQSEIVAGLPQSLYGLQRFNASRATPSMILTWCP